jgi:thiamine-phosphate pyrophosphorylase
VNHLFPPLYAVLDASLVAGGEPWLAAKLAEAGVGMIQYRNKTAGARQVLATCRAIRESLESVAVRFLVNDRADIAAMAGAQGVHVGQDDLPVAEARTVAARMSRTRAGKRGDETGFWVGISTHSFEQVRAASNTDADYIAFGPIFETATKAKLDPVVGLQGLRRARELTRKPLVAIGGITLERAAEVYAAGADCLAVARDLVAAPEPAARARRYLELAP